MELIANAIGSVNLVFLLSAVSVLFLAAAAVCLYLLISQSEKLLDMEKTREKMKRSFNELDEQAKLIVKTDLELNKAQSELDRRLFGLTTLQKVSKSMSKTLDESELFRQIDTAVIRDLGFTKALIMSFRTGQKPIIRSSVGFEEDRLIHITNQLSKNEQFLATLKDDQTLSSLNAPQQIKENVIALFESEHFIVAPIINQNGVIGITFVGNRYTAPAITEGDEEVISILSGQIGQSLENAQLFEQVFKSSQLLETKVRDRTRQLQTALDEVEEISKKKSEFISAVSHELRTPLTSVKGYASLLMSGKLGEIPEKVKERLAKINTHSDNLVQLINNLLDISRIESGRIEMSKNVQSINHCIENMTDLLTPQLKDKGVTIETHLDPNTPTVYIDAGQIERVFINLVSNAIKFTPKEGKITINSEPIPDKDEVVFSVTDTGIGINSEDLKKLFDEFFRVENQINASVKGTGLGLSLVKNIVEAHAGRIWATSKEGKGTTFYFTLPVSEDSARTKAESGEGLRKGKLGF